MCTSGTTGKPKGVCLTHAQLGNLYISTFFKKEDRICCYSSSFWASGLVILISGIFAGSTRLISKDPFSVENFFEIVEKFKPSFVFTPPAHVALIAGSSKIQNCDFSTLNCYLCAGSTVSPSLIAKAQPFMPNTQFIVTYGTSEMPGITISIGPASDNGTVGQLAKNVVMKIIDDDNKSLGPNERGEILVKSSFPFKGYYGNSAANATACDKDGWIHSGDIGYVNDDGFVFVVDRKKDILKYKYFHFSPTEIEDAIMKIPDVVEVCVCGIPDDIFTSLPAALIILKEGSKVSENQIYKHVEDKLGDFIQLRGGVFFYNEIPKNPSGKNVRSKVVDICKSLRENKGDDGYLNFSNLI